jgi:hypothetical protein
VGDNDLAVGEADIGEEAFVALNERAANEPRWKVHTPGYSESCQRFPMIEEKFFTRFEMTPLKVDAFLELAEGLC